MHSLDRGESVRSILNFYGVNTIVYAMSGIMLTDRTEPSVETNWSKGSGWWVQLGMLQRFLRRSVLRSGILRLGVKQWCSCARQSVGSPDTTQPADMIRNRAHIKRVLCVAEKNDAAKGISDIMSNGRFRRVNLSNFLHLCAVYDIACLHLATSCQLSKVKSLCATGNLNKSSHTQRSHFR